MGCLFAKNQADDLDISTRGWLGRVPASDGVLVDVSLVHQVLPLLVWVVHKDPEVLLEIGLDLIGPLVETPLQVGVGSLDRSERVKGFSVEVGKPAKASVAQTNQLHCAAVLRTCTSIFLTHFCSGQIAKFFSPPTPCPTSAGVLLGLKAWTCYLQSKYATCTGWHAKLSGWHNPPGSQTTSVLSNLAYHSPVGSLCLYNKQIGKVWCTIWER